MPQYTPPNNQVVNFTMQPYTPPIDGVVNFVLEDAVQDNYSAIFGPTGQNLFSMTPNSTQGSLAIIRQNS